MLNIDNKERRGKFLLVLMTLLPWVAFGQVDTENRDLIFSITDLRIIQRADSLLRDKSVWNKLDDRKCDDDMVNKKYSLYCALYKASIDVAGEYVHRRSAMQIVRFTLEKYENGRVKEHRLMDWNNHPDTTFEEVKMVLHEAIEHVNGKLKEKH